MNDYGYINGAYNTPTPNRQEIKHTQVYIATHKGEGANARLPFMNRSFISFSFGSKKDGEGNEIPVYIEDFNLIATITGDRLERKGYSEFEDLISEYEVLDGHFYWGTHYTNHELNFELATDGMTQNQLDSFLRWFSAGQVRELILSEHPNRAVQARVSAAPDLHLLPFEQPTTKKIAGEDYKTSTTLYKGEINLSFIMEEPYWYSKINIFGYYDGNVYHDVWVDANNKEVSIFNDPDAIKIALEDNIPIAGMVDASMLLGNNTFADADSSDGAKIADIEYDEYIKYILDAVDTDDDGINEDTRFELDYDSMEGTQEEIDEKIPPQSRIAITKQELGETVWEWGARIDGAIMSESTGIEDFGANQSYYFYYAGTAPSKPLINFLLTPVIDSEGFIKNPKNSYSSECDKPYNTISFESINKKELRFTTPSIYTAYNQAIKIFKNADSEKALVDIRKQIRNEVTHFAVRAWANKVIDSLEINQQYTIGTNQRTAIDRMAYFIQDEHGNFLQSEFTFDSKTGTAIGELKYRVPNSEIPSANEWNTYCYNTLTTHEEDVGDMICSNYLIIEDQNYPTEDGHIKAWEGASDTTRSYSHIIQHDVEKGLQHVFIKYQNMYL